MSLFSGYPDKYPGTLGTYISVAPVLKSITSLRSSVPFLGEYYLETSIWALGMLVANGILLPLGCLSGQS